MASLIDELVEVLDKENTEYVELIALSTEKTGTIVKNDIVNMQRIMEREQAIVDRINALEKKREDVISEICKVLHVDTNDLTVKVLIDLLKKQPAEQEKLQAVHTRIRRTLDKMVRVNENNKALMKESMEILEFEMNLLKGLRMAPETGNYNKGAVSGMSSGFETGTFDAKQ